MVLHHSGLNVILYVKHCEPVKHICISVGFVISVANGNNYVTYRQLKCIQDLLLEEIFAWQMYSLIC